jgi:hypothetical protein
LKKLKIMPLDANGRKPKKIYMHGRPKGEGMGVKMGKLIQQISGWERFC